MMGSKTEEMIREIIYDNFEDATLLIAARRISTIVNCSRILVMRKGRVAEFDTLKNLRENPNSVTYKLLQELTGNSAIPQ